MPNVPKSKIGQGYPFFPVLFSFCTSYVLYIFWMSQDYAHTCMQMARVQLLHQYGMGQLARGPSDEHHGGVHAFPPATKGDFAGSRTQIPPPPQRGPCMPFECLSYFPLPV